MRIPTRSNQSTRGSTLLVALFTVLIIGVALLTYMQLQTNANQLVVRSQVWHQCMPVLEAGIEDALEHCSVNSSNLASNGWIPIGSRYYRTNTVGEGYCVVNMSATQPFDIVSIGYFPMPGSTYHVSRTVRVTTTPVPTFKLAMLSKTTCKMNGNKCRIDSYDSRDPLKSTNGRYDPAKAGDKADVACMSGQPGPFKLGNGDIWGHAIVGPGGTVDAAPNGCVGSVPWQTLHHSGIEPGWVRTDFNTSLPDVTAPFTIANAAPSPGTNIDGVVYNAVFGSGNFLVPNLNNKVAITGSAVIYVTGNIDSQLVYVRTNADVKIYCAGDTASFNSVATPSAASLMVFGLPTVKTIHLGSDWLGAVYAPEADFLLAGGSQLAGSITANSITLKGSSQFHYDEALAAPVPHRGFVITTWTEL